MRQRRTEGFRTRTSKDFYLIPPPSFSDLEWAHRLLLIILSSWVKIDTGMVTSQRCERSEMILCIWLYFIHCGGLDQNKGLLSPQGSSVTHKSSNGGLTVAQGNQVTSENHRATEDLSRGCNPSFLGSLSPPLPLNATDLGGSTWKIQSNRVHHIPQPQGNVDHSFLLRSSQTCCNWRSLDSCFPIYPLSEGLCTCCWIYLNIPPLVFRGLVLASPSIANASSSRQHPTSLVTHPTWLFPIIISWASCFYHSTHPYLLTCLILLNPPDSRSLWREWFCFSNWPLWALTQ